MLVITYHEEKLGTALANGYAYPFLSPALLAETAPFLTYLTPFTYGISRDLGLLPLLSLIHISLLHHGGGDLLEARDVGAGHEIVAQAILLGGLGGDLVDVDHHLLELGIHFLGGPDQALAVLGHLQGGDAHAAGVDGLGGSDDQVLLGAEEVPVSYTHLLLQSGQADSAKINAAVETFAKQYDLFYDASNDFLTAHGYNTIGFIKGYAPHMQGADTQNKLSNALKALGVLPRCV